MFCAFQSEMRAFHEICCFRFRLCLSKVFMTKDQLSVDDSVAKDEHTSKVMGKLRSSFACSVDKLSWASHLSWKYLVQN